MTLTIEKRRTASEVLTALYDDLSKPGRWVQGGDGPLGVMSQDWGKSDCTCLFLGLSDAALTDVEWSDLSHSEWQSQVRVREQAQEILLGIIGIEPGDIAAGYRWNDQRGRTLDEVLNVVRSAAEVAMDHGL